MKEPRDLQRGGTMKKKQCIFFALILIIVVGAVVIILNIPDNQQTSFVVDGNNSCYRALWKCPDCGGEYISSFRDMATGNVDCVYCSMKEVLPGVNSFAVLHPDLMNEWNHLDDYLLCDPDQLLDNCITPVWWTCPVCAHDYKCSPKQRILYQKRNMDACTFCKGLRRKERHYI